MKNLFLLNRSGMSREVNSRKGRLSLGSAVSRVYISSLICLCMQTVGDSNI